MESRKQEEGECGTQPETRGHDRSGHSGPLSSPTPLCVLLMMLAKLVLHTTSALALRRPVGPSPSGVRKGNGKKALLIISWLLIIGKLTSLSRLIKLRTTSLLASSLATRRRRSLVLVALQSSNQCLACY